jgi:hypothetical protein
MVTIEITSWSPGFQMVSCTKLLRATAGLALAEAKHVTDGVLAGQVQYVHVSTLAAADDLVSSLQGLGACAHVSHRS